MSQFKLGLIGGGRMGQTHVRALATSTEVKIVAIVEPYEATFKKLDEAGHRVYATFKEMASAEELDGVLIAAPTDKHLAVISEIAQSKLPILSEKPCGINPEQAREAGKVAVQYGVKLQVAYWRRFVPQLRELAQQIKSGKVGKVHFINASQWDEAPPRKEFRLASGGIFIDMAVHEIDQIRWLTGQEVASTKTLIYPQNEDSMGDTDSTESLLEMKDGSIGLVSLGRFHEGGDLVSAEIFTDKIHQHITIVDPQTGERPQLEALRLQAESFARWVNGGPQEGATSEDAVAALETAFQLKVNAGLNK